jgi:hypothetical protein
MYIIQTEIQTNNQRYIKSEKIIKIPRTYYSKAKDYIEVEKAKVNPDYEQKEIKIPEKYKTDLPNVLYQNVLQGAYPGAYLAYSAYEKYIKKINF